MKRIRLLTICAAIVAFSTTANADTVIFSNDFDDGNLAPEIGTFDFSTTTTSSVVGTTVASPNGAFVGLFDNNNTGVLDATINLTDTALLTGGNTVTIAFDFAARRTNGNSRTIFLDALDSNGDIVTRLVLGDSNAFGNGGTDRQRPGYDPSSAGNDNTGNTPFTLATGTATGTAPGTNFWGSDTSPAEFGFAASVVADAQLSLTIGASTFGFEGDRAFSGPNYTTSGIANYDGNTYADIASIQLSSAGTVYGFYLDNIVVDATLVASAVPEPSSLALLGIAAIGFCGFRRRRS